MSTSTLYIVCSILPCAVDVAACCYGHCFIYCMLWTAMFCQHCNVVPWTLLFTVGTAAVLWCMLCGAACLYCGHCFIYYKLCTSNCMFSAMSTVASCVVYCVLPHAHAIGICCMLVLLHILCHGYCCFVPWTLLFLLLYAVYCSMYHAMGTAVLCNGHCHFVP